MSTKVTTPRRRTDLELRPDGTTSVLVARDGTWLVALNDTATALWELCDGQTSVDEMVLAITTLFDAAAERVRLDVQEAIDDLVAHGVLIPD
jgi:VCBS repeat-containing protein